MTNKMKCSVTGLIILRIICYKTGSHSGKSKREITQTSTEMESALRTVLVALICLFMALITGTQN